MVDVTLRVQSVPGLWLDPRPFRDGSHPGTVGAGSPATVAHHLRKVFTTLGISSRSQLAAALPAQPD